MQTSSSIKMSAGIPLKPKTVLETGDLLFREGDQSHSVAYVISGEFRVEQQIGEDFINVGLVNAGEFVGELGALQGTPRVANVVAQSPAVVQELNCEEFIQQLRSEQNLRSQLISSLSRRNRLVYSFLEDYARSKDTPYRKLVRWFKYLAYKCFEFTEGKSRQAIKAGRTRLFLKDGQVLLYEGDMSRIVYRVVSGKLKVKRRIGGEWLFLGMVKEGDFVGELGVLENKPRTAEVRCLGPATLDCYDYDAFLDLLNHDVNASIAVIRSLSKRSQKLTNAVVSLLSHKKLDARESLRGQLLVKPKNILISRRRLEQDLIKMRQALIYERHNFTEMIDGLQKYISGKASNEDIEWVNKQLIHFLKALGLGTLVVLPGAVITVPVVIKLAKEFGIDLVPRMDTLRNSSDKLLTESRDAKKDQKEMASDEKKL